MTSSDKKYIEVDIKNLITITCCVIIFSFFIRWFNFFGLTVSAYDIVFSGLWDMQPEQNFWTPNYSSGRNYAPLVRYLLLVAPCMAGAILYSLYISPAKFYNLRLNKIPFLALLLFLFLIAGNDNYGSDRKEYIKIFFETVSIGFWLYTIGTVVLFFIGEKYAIPVNEDSRPVNSGDTHRVEQEPEAFQSVREENRPLISPPKFTVPPIDFRAMADKISDFVKQNLKLLLIASLVFVSLIAGYYLFLKNYPDKDAQKVSEKFCDCNETKINDIIKINESFISSFASYAFKSKQDARTKLLELQKNANDRFIECDSKFQNTYADLRKKYYSNPQELDKFDFTFNAAKQACITSNEQKLSLLSVEAEKKIATINDPEPDIEKIKNDLLGRQVTGWKFDFLNEFKGASIVETLKANGRIEFHTKFVLQGLNDLDPHDCETLVVYLQNEFGWFLSDVRLVSITYTNIAPVDSWATTYGYENCKVQVLDNPEKYWIQSLHYSGRYQAGGNDGEKFDLEGRDFQISSRENHPVKVVFKYTPTN